MVADIFLNFGPPHYFSAAKARVKIIIWYGKWI